MHILIITDLEGISGVGSIDAMNKESEGYKKACEQLMEDTNAAVAGAFAGGADRVSVIDGHGGGDNFIKEKLDPRAVQVPAGEFTVMSVEDYDADAIFAVGAHAMAGTENAFLDHTQSSMKWFDYRINGMSYGELGQQAICYGAAEIPLVMVSGDAAACCEAEKLAPGVATAVVKTAKGRNNADCIPPEEARRAIYEAARLAISKAGEIKPYKITLPARLELTLCRNDYADEIIAASPELERCGRTLTKKLKKISCYHDLAGF